MEKQELKPTEAPIRIKISTCFECHKRISGDFWVEFYPQAKTGFVYCEECAKELGYKDDSK